MHLSADIGACKLRRDADEVLDRISVLDVFCEVGQGRRELRGLRMKSGVIWTWMVILAAVKRCVVRQMLIGVVGSQPITDNTSDVRRSLVERKNIEGTCQISRNVRCTTWVVRSSHFVLIRNGLAQLIKEGYQLNSEMEFGKLDGG